jgi:hypothetical protein
LPSLKITLQLKEIYSVNGSPAFIHSIRSKPRWLLRFGV